MNKMPSSLYDLLKEKLGEDKYQDSLLIDLISDVYDKAEAAKDIQTANADLAEKKKALKESVENLESKIVEQNQEIERLQKNMLTDDDKENFKNYKAKGMTAEIEAIVNKQNEQIEQLTKKFENSEAERELKDKKLAEATKGEFRAKSISQFERELASVGIKSAKKMELAMAIVDKRNSLRVEETEDGTYKLGVYTERDGKLMPSTTQELAKELAEEHEYLVDSSGKSGPGVHYNPSYENGSRKYESLSDVKEAAHSMWDK